MLKLPHNSYLNYKAKCQRKCISVNIFFKLSSSNNISHSCVCQNVEILHFSIFPCVGGATFSQWLTLLSMLIGQTIDLNFWPPHVITNWEADMA